MAHKKCFYHLTSLFFSTLPSNYEKNFKEEIWGCFKYIGIPIETVMNMPVQNRKYFISRHNHDTDELNKKYSNDKSVGVTGEATAQYSQISINDYKRLTPH